jgi:class 3 adenylate cyclase
MKLPQMRFSIAAAAGRVLAGQIGTERLRGFDVLGAPANVAVKLTTAATLRDVDNLVTGDVIAPDTSRATEVEGIELGGKSYRLYRV